MSALRLVESILNLGLDGRIARVMLASKLEQSGEIRLTRDLISSSYKYGLTIGSYASEYLQVTEEGQELLTLGNSSKQAKERLFEIAVSRVDPFNKLYQKIKTKNLPGVDVLSSEFTSLGIPSNDASKAANIFQENIKYIGLIVSVGHREQVQSIESLIEQVPLADNEDIRSQESLETQTSHNNATDTNTLDSESSVPLSSPRNRNQFNEPSVHIDIQIHIDSSATPEQIDQIFAGMARHLYGRGG